MNDSHQIIDDDEKVNNHVMGDYPYFKCLTHKDCHLNSFYPGKLYRAMEMEKNEDGILKMKKKGENGRLNGKHSNCNSSCN